MAEPLVVDTSRLEAAGATLQGLAFPVAPAAIVFAGTDSVSAAINETLPIIESPVTEGLPTVEAAVTRTGSSIAAAAGIYSDTDQRLGDHVNQVQFLSADGQSAGGTPVDRLAGASVENTTDGVTEDQPADAETPTPEPDSTLTPGSVAPQLGQMGQYAQTAGYAAQGIGTAGSGATPAQPATAASASQPDSTLTPGSVAPQLGRLGQYAQTAGYATQSMQGIQGAAGRGATPAAQPATDSSQTTPDDRAQMVDDTKKDDEEEQQPETLTEGAVAGDQTSEGAPIKPTTPGQPGTTPSEIEL